MSSSIPAPGIEIKHVAFSYVNTLLFNDFNLSLRAGQCTCLLGPSGVGKTTLLRLIAGLTPTQGVHIVSCDITADNHMAVSKQVTYHPQTDSLLPWFTALDNTLLGARLRGTLSHELIARAKNLFSQVGLSGVENKFPSALSVGMRQRVALIRTFLEDKPIVLMDEPFANLDTVTRLELQTLTAELLRNRTVLLVTHDPLEALRLGDNVLILGGQPANISTSFTFDCEPPRDVTNPTILQHQADLLQALIHAKQAML